MAQPFVKYAVAQSFLKGEDLVIVQPRNKFPKVAHQDAIGAPHFANGAAAEVEIPPECIATDACSCSGVLGMGAPDDVYGLYCVFDGHNGRAAAAFLKDNLFEALHMRLPAGRPPPEGDVARHRLWREALQRAAIEALDDVQQDFACLGVMAGATVTIVIQAGWLITVANLGDSTCMLDTGAALVPVSIDHRVATHQLERRRLEALGALIAPIDVSSHGPAAGPDAAGWGPLRVWPGGLCLSRAFGDFDVGSVVISLPHITQVRVPNTGGRLCIASDGLWDAYENVERLTKMWRPWDTEAVPERVMAAIRRAYGGLKDDTTVIVLDLLPPGRSFPAVCGIKTRPSAGPCSCLAKAPVLEETDEEAPAPGAAEVVADLDVAAVIGLIPHEASPPPQLPSWYTSELAAQLEHSQTAVCEAWKAAAARKDAGRASSRADLARYFELGGAGGALPARAFPHRHTTGPDIGRPAERVIPAAYGGPPPPERPPRHAPDYTVKIGEGPGQALGGKPRLPAQPDASVRFRDSVSSPGEFAAKFGRYSSPDDKHMPASTLPDHGPQPSPPQPAPDGQRRAVCDDTARGVGRVADKHKEDAAVPHALDASQRYAEATARGSSEFARRFGHYASGTASGDQGLADPGGGALASLQRISANLRRTSIGSQPDRHPVPEFTVRASMSPADAGPMPQPVRASGTNAEPGTGGDGRALQDGSVRRGRVSGALRRLSLGRAPQPSSMPDSSVRRGAAELP